MNLRSLPILIICLGFIAVISGCRNTPKGVIPPAKMVDLLTDIHKGEAYTDLNYSEYRTDSAKLAFRNAVFNKYGVTIADYDSSMMWYGHNIDDYIEIYDKVIARLENEVEEAGNVAMVANTVVGDSVNAWYGDSYYVISKKMPSRFIDFRIESDDTWEKGDSYTWQFKTFNKQSPLSVGLFIDYEDGSTDFRLIDTENDGWNRLTVVTDTLRNPVSVYGYMNFELLPDEEFYIDSLSLVRKRLDMRTYRSRHIQTKFNMPKRIRM